MSRASTGLLVLGGAALAGVANAHVPRRVGYARTAASVVPAWLLSELPLHVVVAGAAAGAALVRAGGAGQPAGRVGLGLLAGAGALVTPAALRSRAVRVRLDGFDDTPPDVPYPASHVALPPLAWCRRDISRRRGIEYARIDGRRLRMDITLPSAPPGRVPAIVHVHGGGMLFGSRREQGVALLGHLAANGWAGFNIDYRHSPRVTFPAQLHDIKRAIVWIRAHADEFGVDPSFVGITGGSAGGQLAALTALTNADPALQPGFEDADASVQAAVPFYGIYDVVDQEGLHLAIIQDALERWIIKAPRAAAPEAFARASPVHHVRPDAPPFMIIHGDRDSLVPIAEARRFAERLRTVSEQRVALVELPGAQHAFDIFPSWHTIPVIDAVERFLRTTYTEHQGQSSTATICLDVTRVVDKAKGCG